MSEHTRRIAELKAAVQAAKDRVREFNAERKESARRVERARADLLAFYRRQGRGESDGNPPGEPSEAELQARLREAEGVAPKLRPVYTPMGGASPDGDGGPQVEVGLEAIDEADEERYAGAKEALEDREAELRAYVAANHEQITVDRAHVAGSLRNQCAALLSEAASLGAAWEGFRSTEVELLTLADRADLIDQIPDNPMRWAQEAKPDLPMPISFTG